MPPDVIAGQIDAVLADFDVLYAKTGMLSRAETVRLVAARVRQHGLKVVVDPVMAAEAGGRLLDPDAVDALRHELLPLAEVTTPNVHEAGVLAGVEVRDMDSAKEACRKIHALGVRYVVLTGGHFGGRDILYDGEKFTVFEGPLVKGGTHGTGCTYAAAMTAFLAKGETIENACDKAKRFVKEAVLNSMDVGHGVHPVNPGCVK